MSWTEHARRLVAYDYWANEKVLAAADTLDDAALDRVTGASQQSIRATLLHIAGAQSAWLARWTRSQRVVEGTRSARDPREMLDRMHHALAAFVAGLTDADWHRPIDYTDTAGKPHRVPLGQLITHVASHGTHHRAEAGLMLAQAGASPGDMDYVYFTHESPLIDAW